MLKINRKEKILEILNNKKDTRINNLCNILNVSIATIHRDLDELEREGRIKKVFGGVILNNTDDFEIINKVRLNTNVDLKKRISAKALELVKNGDCLFIDNSTTCYYFAKALSESEFKNLVIVTNSYLIPGLFIKNENIQVVSTGGLLIKDMNSFAGPCAITAINEFNGNKFFFSVAAISINGDLSDIYDIDLVTVKREMFKRSKEKICLVDSSKFNKVGQSKIFNISQIDKIITDSNCDKDKREEIAMSGVRLILG
ncbi:MAG: DeoR/GlpR family DNA-binding transcription regulator [Actinomycetota bacterium]|nr:DeoR/GlpR family DNA-binding transcription regulator [Actinomycetota bacterium]